MSRKIEWQEMTLSVQPGSANSAVVTKSETIVRYHRKPTVPARVLRYALKKAAGEAARKSDPKRR